jgi:hypothetical protein
MVAAAVADSMVAVVAVHSLHRADRVAAQDTVVVLGKAVVLVGRAAPMGRTAEVDMDYFARNIASLLFLESYHS